MANAEYCVTVQVWVKASSALAAKRQVEAIREHARNYIQDNEPRLNERGVCSDIKEVQECRS